MTAAGDAAPEIDRDALLASKAWPLAEAQKLLARVGTAPPDKGFVLFETGYGPSGLPHVGTFGEVFRTSVVRHAFAELSDLPTRLYAFSDDMDGLRKVPDNVPNRAMVAEHLGRPLTAIPDPFGTHESFGAHMNARLRAFLDSFGFDYEFKSATECYRAGVFDAKLRTLLERYDEVKTIVLPHLRDERRASYSPVLPLDPDTGRVLQVPIERVDPDAGTVVFTSEAGRRVEREITGGRAKLQWRADWALRWAALGVDYEMYGKDLIDSAKLSGRIARVLGGGPPEGFFYELFLDEMGGKISKSRGNGFSAEEWLRYGTREGLALYMYQSPKKAKRLHLDVIPRHEDDYAAFLDRYPGQDARERLGNPVWHIKSGRPPVGGANGPGPLGGQVLSYAMLLNLATVANVEEPAELWRFIEKYAPDATPETAPRLDELVGRATAYYRDFVKPTRRHRAPDARERAALVDLLDVLGRFGEGADAEAVQFEVYEVGKRHGFEPLRAWFQALYAVLLGREEGPRFGSFAVVYGLADTRLLIETALAGGLVEASADRDAAR